MSENIFRILSSRSFMLSHLMFKSLCHFESIFISVYGVRVCSNFIDLHVSVQHSQHDLLKSLFPFCIFLPPLVKILTIAMWVYFWALYSVPLIHMSVFVLIQHSFDYCSFVVLSEVWESCASCFVLFPQDRFDNSVTPPLSLPYKSVLYLYQVHMIASNRLCCDYCLSPVSLSH